MTTHYLMRAAVAPLVLGLFACTTTVAEEPASSVEGASISSETAAPTEILPVIPMTSAPLDMDKPLTRIAFGSCLQQDNDQSIWPIIGGTDPDVFLYIGDNVYGDVWSEDPTLPELREAYRTLAQSAPFTEFRTEVPLMVTWDDHDYGLNDAGGSWPFRYGGEALFEEAWALRADDPRRTRPGIYTAHTVGPEGQRVQIILLDTRFFRSDLKPTDERGAPGKERYLPDPDPSKTMLGEAQYAWLADALKEPADVRLVVSSIQVIADGHGWEAWATLPTDRQRLYDTIDAAGAEGVIFVSGDRHAGALYRQDAALDYPAYEITSSSLNAPASIWRARSGETRVEDGPNRLGTMEYDVNFGLIDIDWEAGQVTLSLRGAEAEVLQDVVIELDALKN